MDEKSVTKLCEHFCRIEAADPSGHCIIGFDPIEVFTVAQIQKLFVHLRQMATLYKAGLVVNSDLISEKFIIELLKKAEIHIEAPKETTND